MSDEDEEADKKTTIETEEDKNNDETNIETNVKVNAETSTQFLFLRPSSETNSEPIILKTCQEIVTETYVKTNSVTNTEPSIVDGNLEASTQTIFEENKASLKKREITITATETKEHTKQETTTVTIIEENIESQRPTLAVIDTETIADTNTQTDADEKPDTQTIFEEHETHKTHKKLHDNTLTADVIILGCSLPGIVTAHNLKKKFGNSMDIIVLDLSSEMVVRQSQLNVSFGIDAGGKEDVDSNKRAILDEYKASQQYMLRYAEEFRVELPETVIKPQAMEVETDMKLFEYSTGGISQTTYNYHDYKFVNLFQRFELGQFNCSLKEIITSIFLEPIAKEAKQLQLIRLDEDSMENFLCQSLFLETSRDVMRTMVKVVCGVEADKVSVLFYLHQCYKASGADQHLGGANTRTRERLLAVCQRRLVRKLMNKVSKITRPTKPITQISKFPDQRVMLKTLRDEETYVCTQLALALRPEQLNEIELEDELIQSKELELMRNMRRTDSTKFIAQYEENFWRAQGYSGEIFSVKGPILWAMEKPKLSGTGSEHKYHALIGYLDVGKCKDLIELDEDDGENVVPDHREEVLAQLVSLFGEEAADPVAYKETNFVDLYVPRCGDYVGLMSLMDAEIAYGVEWGALDVFGDGDLSASLEAGHNAYLHLLNTLRPQARSFSELNVTEWQRSLPRIPVCKYFCSLNYISGVKMVFVGACVFFAHYSLREILIGYAMYAFHKALSKFR